MQPGHVFRHPLFLVTFIIAIPCWIVAFAGQAASEAKYDVQFSRAPVVGSLWFAIWLQLAVIIHLFLAIANDQLAMHRFQLAIFTAVCLVFAVQGVNNIYSDGGALIAVGVGWLLLAMVDILWLFYLTSEEDSSIYRLLSFGNNGGLTSPSAIRPRRHTSIHGSSGRRDSDAAALTPNGMGSTHMGLNGNGNAHSNGGYPSGGYATAPIDTTPQKMENSASARTGLGSMPSGRGLEEGGGAATSLGGDHQYKYRAKALYSYSASPDDPNEVSFNKNDVLDVVDNSGKWYQVRTPAGQTGIAPSNYLEML